jgi:hypothetical protein
MELSFENIFNKSQGMYSMTEFACVSLYKNC